jgi:carbon storage regulator CsrA
MLVLSRKLQQQIKIGEQITVTILRVKGNTVRVGIQAPRDVRVIRGELPKNEEAAASPEPVEGEMLLTIPAEECAEPSEPTEEPAGVHDTASNAIHAPPQLPTAHLPLRRIHQRYGRAPLKHIVAATSHSLAK